LFELVNAITEDKLRIPRIDVIDRSTQDAEVYIREMEFIEYNNVKKMQSVMKHIYEKTGHKLEPEEHIGMLPVFDSFEQYLEVINFYNMKFILL
jgi:hypothetical protein